jgi:hypothetical protein
MDRMGSIDGFTIEKIINETKYKNYLLNYGVIQDYFYI